MFQILTASCWEYLPGVVKAQILPEMCIGLFIHHLKRINGIDCIYKYYETKMNSYPVVYNHVYLFFNVNLTHKIDIMYRSTEAEYWENSYSDIRKVI